MHGIALDGNEIGVTVFPEAGGKILDLVHKPSGKNLLWRNPRVGLMKTYPGAPFDDVWCGGWDDLFPTDAPCVIDGVAYHDHGDLWIGPWEWSLQRDDAERAVLYLRRHSVSLPCLAEKWVSVGREETAVVVRHRLTNLGAAPISYFWNQHVAHAIEPGSRVQLPATRVGVEPSYPGRSAGGAGTLSWPSDATTGDLSVLPGPEAGLTEWLFSEDLREGCCAVTHPGAGVGLELSFDRSIFPTVWLWGVFGGWRGHHVLLTEPCTSRPGSLADSIARGDAASLEGGEAVETEVVATVLTDIESPLRAESTPTAAVTE